MTPKLLMFAALLASAPALAQPAPPPPGAPHASQGAGHAGMAARRGNDDRRERMFPSMSEAGRATLKEAMMAGGDRRANRAAIDAAREKLLTALAADRLDIAAVRRAMDEERAVSDASRQARQAAMLAAFQKLSTEDRKAFVTDSRAMKDRMDKRMDTWRKRLRERSGNPPPPPPRPGDDGADAAS